MKHDAWVSALASASFIPLTLGLCISPALADAYQKITNVADDSPIHIPLTVIKNPAYGTYRAFISVGIGKREPAAFLFDTGSSGLHVFADTKLDQAGSGATCTRNPARIVYGNPARIQFNGVVCHAPLHIGNYTLENVPVAYLTSASCPETNPGCKIPDLNDPRQLGGYGGYGVFGSGITGVVSPNGGVPNPFRTIAGRHGATFSIILSREKGELILGSAAPDGAQKFSLKPSGNPGQEWGMGNGCLFVNGRSTKQCAPRMSFDTGNGVPLVRMMYLRAIPQSNGTALPSTRIGIGPVGSSYEATSVAAGASFPDRIRVEQLVGNGPIINLGIRAFFDHIVTYDAKNGVISIAPAH